MYKLFLAVTLLGLGLSACKPDDPDPTPRAHLRFRYKFDSTQVRLDNLGNPSTLPAGHSAQSPQFNKMSAHYIELTPDMWTPLGAGFVAFHNPETDAGGATAIDFSRSILKGNGEIFRSLPIDSVEPGTYNFIRVSLAYQNYNIRLKALNLPLTGTIASFIGYNTYIGTFSIQDSSLTVNDDKTQGFWAFESDYGVISGQAPPGATTVPNPIFATSPVPPGSCVVTGQFSTPLVITGNETEDIIVEVSLSTNNSFEWTDSDGDGWYEPLEGDTVVDMGIRGLIPRIE